MKAGYLQEKIWQMAGGPMPIQIHHFKKNRQKGEENSQRQVT
jgi:hypothetical protein